MTLQRYSTRYASQRLVALVGAATALILSSANPVRAQTAVTPSDSSAWWAQNTPVDSQTRCAAELAWDHARDIEAQAESDLDTDHLSEMLSGAELARENSLVETLQAVNRGVSRDAVATWHVVGGAPDEVVLYTSTTRRAVYVDWASGQATGRQWVETEQAADLVVRQTDGWRLADRHVFEQRRHPLDLVAAAAVAEAYQQAWTDLLTAYSDGDSDALTNVLDGQALDLYRQRLQALSDAGKQERVGGQGRAYLIDVQNDTALLAWQGTLTENIVDDTTGPQGTAVQESVALIHGLQWQDGKWKDRL